MLTQNTLYSLISRLSFRIGPPFAQVFCRLWNYGGAVGTVLRSLFKEPWEARGTVLRLLFGGHGRPEGRFSGFFFHKKTGGQIRPDWFSGQKNIRKGSGATVAAGSFADVRND